MTKIATVETFEDAVEKLLRVWGEAGRPRLVRFEGFDGVGKSGLGQLFCERTGAAHIKGDAYITKPETEQPYKACIRLPELEAAIGAAVASGEIVVLDAVCLDEIASESQWGRGFVVYVKRLSFNNWDPMWHEGNNLQDPAPDHEIQRSVHEYHNRVKPHLTANIIIEFPDPLHSISPGKYSRDCCFDPPEADVI